MYEAIGVEGYTHMQFLAREMQEYQIPGAQIAAGDGNANALLFSRRPRQSQPDQIGRIKHETAAIESAGSGTAEFIGLPQHGSGVADDGRTDLQDAGPECILRAALRCARVGRRSCGARTQRQCHTQGD